ncbi:MAG: M3 family metallopeptidase [Ignavibacteria bacterium]|nr:M3 family metallopeptidase [Ignavibacteria bacterium]
MRYVFCLLIVVGIAGMSMNAQTTQTTAQINPLLMQWNTPFGIPPFDQIKDEHFLPAVEAGIAEQRKEVDIIANSTEPPMFANTIEALDATGELLSKVSAVFGNLSSAETNDNLQAIARRITPLTSALRDDIMLNEKLFARVKAVWEQRDKLKLRADQIRLLEETYKNFVRSGANLTPQQKERLRKINEESSLLSLRFGENLLKETNNYRLVIEKKEDLAGLPDGVIAAAADAAKSAGMEGKWVFTLHAPSIWPFMTYAENRDLRRQIFTAYIMRGDQGNERDNKSLLVKIAALRAERAKLLGFPTHAHFVLDNRMAKTPENVYGLLNRLWPAALNVAKKEIADMQALIKSEGKEFKLEPWDWWFYAEKVKKAKYDLDENVVREYFTLENVRQGAFTVATKLYGVSFVEHTNLPKYHSEVRAFEVKDKDGSHLALFLVDYHPRAGKRSGAWASRYRSQQIREGKDIRPIVVNVCNFTRPIPGQPALLRLEEVETLFHEFGHALHSIFSRIHYRGIAGVPTDFVELPSQIMENWALEPEVLKIYAKHWQTGAVIPDELIRKIENAEKFNQGFKTVEYLAASYLDLDWHTFTEPKEVDAGAFEKSSLQKIGLMPEIVSRYRSPYFQHIFSGGYSAGYYSYIWSEVLDSDAFTAFKEKGIFDQPTAASFRKNILEKGGTEEAMEMYKKFRGREPSVEPLLEKRGLK